MRAHPTLCGAPIPNRRVLFNRLESGRGEANHGIGWIFWLYKNIHQTTTVASVPMSAEWKVIVNFADRFADDRNATPPDQAAIERAFEG